MRGLHSYLGTIELRSASDGIAVVDVLPLERYLLGLNEVPMDWPMEALRAQAVAARTYSLWTLETGRAGAAEVYGFDICASDQCQVFSGADVLRGPEGMRWQEAVRSTAGTAVLHGGQPILARYHSTSGGHTLDNSEAFEGSADLSYLQGVPSPAENGSPFFRWEVPFGLGDFEKMLHTAGSWSRSHGELREVRTVASRAGKHYPDVVLRGDRGTLVVSAEELRSILRLQGPRVRPHRYPSLARDGVTRLPETLPSNRFEIETSGRTLEATGRGWGHGVGMSQWGAHGMARDGSSHEDILAHYYRGTSLGDVAPGEPVEVGVAWGRDASSAFGAFRIVDGLGNTVVARAFGTWAFTWEGPGAVAVRAPRGFGRAPKVSVERAPARVRAGETAALRVRLSAPSRVTTSTTGPDLHRSTVAVRNRGHRRLEWRAPERPGRYRIVVRASAGSATDASGSHEVTVVGAPESMRSPGGGGSLGATILQAVAAAALVALVAVGVASFAGTISR